MQEGMTDLEIKLHAGRYEFGRRVGSSVRMIETALASGRRFYVSWSGGKDSTAMLHLIRSVSPSIPVMHIRSGYEMPDGAEYMKKIVEDWGLNFTEIDAPCDYMDLCREFGLPHTRSWETQQEIVRQIKKQPGRRWALDHAYDGMFWGLRAEESKARCAICTRHRSGIIDSSGIERIAPIGDWSARDVWAYILSEGIPPNPIYLHEGCGQTRMTIRNAGWLSTDGAERGRLEWLRRFYPEQYRKVREML
ncbi:MAG: phosphoadenosine phosphosulfate reductase family protein [Rectinema sp.]